MWTARKTRCRLNKDLTRLHPALVLGALGTLLPGVTTSGHGWQDRFGAVAFDAGPTMDMVLIELDLLDPPIAVPVPETPLKPGETVEVRDFGRRGKLVIRRYSQ